MALITVEEANSWADQVKLNLSVLDSELEESMATQVLARVSQAYETTSWVSSGTTPKLIRKIIAMMYVGWYFQRTYSEEEETNSYGLMLIAQAERLIEGIVTGSLSLPDSSEPSLNVDAPSFYPTDASSLLTPTVDDPSLGGAKFSMGTIW